jgi:3-methylcrotonyl-CoA carboxylase alpha subunit
MTEEMRAAMGEAAVRAAKAIGYRGAGTVEFIVDGSDGLRPDRFWFMEMNTRLQVEHPVTEAVTGVDLVEWQLRVSSGEALPCRQADLALSGHAFEARLYAEDVPAGFLPATGRLAHLRFADGCRVETGVREGDVISPWYDPMIAKIVVAGPTRGAALRTLARALAETEVAGTVTNLGFLKALAQHEGFGKGAVDTGLIDRELAALAAEPAPARAVVVAAVLAAAGLWQAAGPLAGFALWAPLPRRVGLRRGEEEIAAVIRVEGPDRVRVAVGGTESLAERRGGWWIDGAKGPRRVVRMGQRVEVFDGAAFGFELVDPLQRELAHGAGEDVTASPMPGLVKAVFVEAGQAVAKGDRLAVLEAMKMEHVLVAGRDGLVAEVMAVPGAQVEAGAALVRLEAEA